MTLRRLARWATATLIGAATMTSLSVSAETATLRVSIEGGAFNSKLKFFDASEGCPGYNYIPGAKDYLGSVFASDKGADIVGAQGGLINEFFFKISDAGGPDSASSKGMRYPPSHAKFVPKHEFL
jgi:hypothetical protein